MKLIREIKNRRGDIHFQRFAIFQSRLFNIYLHKIWIEDRQPDIHNHPWNFLGIILKGGYVEYTPTKTNTRKPGAVFWGNRKQYHKVLRLLDKPNVSLFFTFGEHKPWGYQKNMVNI